MEIEEIKSLLPHGSYKKIAEAAGVKVGTIKIYFSNATVRLSEATEQRIRKEAEKIIEENSLNGLELLHGEQKIKKVKAALAA